MTIATEISGTTDFVFVTDIAISRLFNEIALAMSMYTSDYTLSINQTITHSKVLSDKEEIIWNKP